jgi:hypothetical protein
MGAIIVGPAGCMTSSLLPPEVMLLHLPRQTVNDRFTELLPNLSPLEASCGD